MPDWQDLDREFDAWLAEGRTATMWWRDDDARIATEALVRLLDTAGIAGVPLALAVIPREADATLCAAIRRHHTLTVLQHGFAHRNHAPAGEKKAELGLHRSVADICAELIEGWDRLVTVIENPKLPVVVPPWNRIADGVMKALPLARFKAVSAWGARPSASPVTGLTQVNTHIDIIDWQGHRGFVGRDPALRQAVGHLKARRTGAADADEPTGLLTHHLAHDGACWDFIAEFLSRTQVHDAVQWLEAPAVFGLKP